MQQFCTSRQKIDIKAIVISSALFAIMHTSPWQMIHPFALGCIIAFVYLATKSIWASVIVHFSNNALVLLLGYLLNGGFEAFVIANWWWIMLISLAIISVIIWLFAKQATATPQADDEQLKLRRIDVAKSMSVFTAGVVFCVFMLAFVIIG